jgi:nucleoside-diphosphate-sugar epimerase
VKILILGVNGFIGSFLAERILRETDWEVTGLDPSDYNLSECRDRPRFSFRRATMADSWDWIDERVASSDLVVPLAGIAKPAVYMKDPLLIYELDFEQNLRVVRSCAASGTRVVFPSTSEVYGMSPDRVLDEEESPLVLGPIRRTRWIYSCSKQMMDRVIVALGEQRGLSYTLFRPFNWIGPRQDDLRDPERGQSRVLTQFIYNALNGRPLVLAGGGAQRRSFTDIEEGIDGLMRILENRGGAAEGRIFNLGNPANNASIRDLALQVREAVARIAGRPEESIEIVERPAEDYYGQGYQDVEDRLPSIERARTLLGWNPSRPLAETVDRTVRHFLERSRA